MEIPTAPPELVKGLKEYDKRLDIRFSSLKYVWEVVEWIPKQRTWSHCFFWADGGDPDYKFKRLPPTADPLKAKLAVVDWARYGSSHEGYERLKARSSQQRADMVKKARQINKEKMVEYNKWMRDNWTSMARKYEMGGGSRKQAIKARYDAAKEILDDGKS